MPVHRVDDFPRQAAPHQAMLSPTPQVIAHRGASGYLPEHTREAKVLAYGQGADYLEQDVVATRDGRLIVLHDHFLDDVTDVAVRFPGRCRADGRHYVIDFDLEEIRGLRVVERRVPGRGERRFPERFAEETLAFGVATLEEEIRLIQALNRTSGRRVGLYPEIKHPGWHRRHGIDLSRLLLEALDAHGYRSAADGAIVQCLDAAELRRCRRELGTKLRLAQLLEEHAPPDAVPCTPEALARIRDYAEVLAPHHSQLAVGRESAHMEVGELAHRAAAAGLELHPYTFRRDELPLHVPHLETLLEFFYVEVGVGAVFCDHPDIAVAVRGRVAGRGGKAG